jgi:hypothetical protein
MSALQTLSPSSKHLFLATASLNAVSKPPANFEDDFAHLLHLPVLEVHVHIFAGGAFVGAFVGGISADFGTQSWSREHP